MATSTRGKATTLKETMTKTQLLASLPAQRRRATTPLFRSETARPSRASSADPSFLIGLSIDGNIQHLCLRAGYDAARQIHDVVRDLARPREPHMPNVNVRPNMLKRAPELN